MWQTVLHHEYSGQWVWGQKRSERAQEHQSCLEVFVPTIYFRLQFPPSHHSRLSSATPKPGHLFTALKTTEDPNMPFPSTTTALRWGLAEGWGGRRGPQLPVVGPGWSGSVLDKRLDEKMNQLERESGIMTQGNIISGTYLFMIIDISAKIVIKLLLSNIICEKPRPINLFERIWEYIL